MVTASIALGICLVAKSNNDNRILLSREFFLGGVIGLAMVRHANEALTNNLLSFTRRVFLISIVALLAFLFYRTVEPATYLYRMIDPESIREVGKQVYKEAYSDSLLLRPLLIFTLMLSASITSPAREVRQISVRLTSSRSIWRQFYNLTVVAGVATR